MSASLVTLAEGAAFNPVFCSGAALPEPEPAPPAPDAPCPPPPPPPDPAAEGPSPEGPLLAAARELGLDEVEEQVVLALGRDGTSPSLLWMSCRMAITPNVCVSS